MRRGTSQDGRTAVLGIRSSLLVAISVSLPAPVFAHHGMGGRPPETFLQGLLSGLAHPVIGWDHFVFLLMAGVLAYSLDFPSRCRALALFVASGIFGTLVHLSALSVPGSEAMIAISVIAAGALVLSHRRPGTLRLALLLAVAGAFHGYAYADSVVGVDGTALGAYLTGLALIQCLVVVATPIALKAAVDGLASRRGARLVAATALRAHGERLAGGVAVAVGALFLAAGIA